MTIYTKIRQTQIRKTKHVINIHVLSFFVQRPIPEDLYSSVTIQFIFHLSICKHNPHVQRQERSESAHQLHIFCASMEEFKKKKKKKVNTFLQNVSSVAYSNNFLNTGSYTKENNAKDKETLKKQLYRLWKVESIQQPKFVT